MQFQYRVRKKGNHPQKIIQNAGTQPPTTTHSNPPKETMKLNLETTPPPMKQPSVHVPQQPVQKNKKQIVPKKRILVVQNAVPITTPTPNEHPDVQTNKIALDVHVMEEMKVKMSNQINQQLSQQKRVHEEQLRKLQSDEQQKIRDLQAFSKQQEEKRQQELQAFSALQQSLLQEQRNQWEREHEEKLRQQSQALEEKWTRALQEKDQQIRETNSVLETQKRWLEGQQMVFLNEKEEWIKEQKQKQSQITELLQEQEKKIQEQEALKQSWFQEQQKQQEEAQKEKALKEQWLQEQSQKQEELKREWLQEQSRKQEELKREWLAEQERRDKEREQARLEQAQQEQARLEQAQQEQIRATQESQNTNFIKENDLEPALEKFITQVINCTVENETPETKFEQMIGPTIEKLVRKILEADNQETISDENSSISDKSVHYDDVYDFEIDDDSIQNIRSALRRNSVVNPLYNKKEREQVSLEIETNTNAATETNLQTNSDDSPSVEIRNIYNDSSTKFFENELRSKEYANKRWFTFGNGVQKDSVTAVYVEPTNKIIIICGLFKSINRSEVQNIAKFNYDRKEWNSMGGGVNNMATCLTKLGDYIYVGGVFSKSGNSVDTKNISKFNLKTKAWSPLGPGLSSECCALCVDETNKRLYAGGTFTHSGSTELKYVGIYNTETDTWERLVGGELNAPCRTLFLDHSTRQIYAGGLFTSAGTENTSYIAQYDLDDSKWYGLSQGLQGYCNSIYVHKNVLYAGGTFTCVGNNIAKYDLEKKQWTGLQDGLNGICNAVVVNKRGQVFTGGSFTCDNENDEMLNRIAMFDVKENKWYALENHYNKKETEKHHIGLDSVCKSLFITDDNLYVVGSFQKAGNIDAGCIAKYKL